MLKINNLKRSVKHLVIIFVYLQIRVINTNDLNNTKLKQNPTALEDLVPTWFQLQTNLIQDHYCTYRYFLPYPAYHFKLLTGWSCYNYAQPKWMKGEKIFNATLGTINNMTQFRIPYIQVNDEAVLFDYEDPTYTKVIRDLHIEGRFYQKWLDCARTAMDCCKAMDQAHLIPDEEYPCSALWDGYTCYGRTRGNTEVKKLCPTYLATGEKLVCNLRSLKICQSNGWNQQTEYIHCSSSFVYRDRHTFHVIVLSVAIIFMLPSIIIFFSFDKLKIIRIALHRNVIIAIFLKNIFVVISKNVVVLDTVNNQQEDTVMEDDGPWCRTLSFFQILSINLVFSCMTADAYHSHKSIARAFAKDTNEYIMYAIIVVAACIPTFIWLILILINNIGQCWIVETNGYQWISDGYKYGCLTINLILLFDIIRVLYLKFRKNSAKNAGRALKATVILLCLFGIPLIVSSQRGLVNMDNCLDGDIYIYVTYSIEAMQGIFMALFFCYLNREALNELKCFWRHLVHHVNEKRLSFRETLKRKTQITQLTQASDEDKSMELAPLK